MQATIHGPVCLIYIAILQKIEMGKSQWGDNFERLEHMILTMRPTSALSTAKSGKKCPGGNTSSDSEKVLFCSAYQRGNCSFSQGHMTAWKGDASRQVFVHHICAKCLLSSGKKASHPETSDECPLRK